MGRKYPALFTVGIITAIVLSLLVTGQLSGSEKNPLERKVDLLMEFMGNSTRGIVPKEQKALALMAYFLKSFEDKGFSDVVGLKEIDSIYPFDIKGEESKVLIAGKWAKIEWENVE